MFNLFQNTPKKNNQKQLLGLFFIISLLLTGCSTDYLNTNPIGQKFPAVKGESLTKKDYQLPQDFSGKQVLLLLGYVQNSQFDIDRWLIGLDMTNTVIDVYEIPTIQGMIPRFFETQINEGMRKGIPKDLWKGVVTIYEDGNKVQKFTGNINPNNARVILLDKEGKVIYFYDGGFSVNALNQLRGQIK